MVESSSSEQPSLSWAKFGPILAIHFLGTLGFSLAIPLLVFLVVDFGGADWTYGIVGATYSAFQLLGAPKLGRWSDQTGRRPVLVVSQVGTLVAWLLFLIALSLPVVRVADFAGATLTVPLLLLFVARALDGATGGNISVANAYVADLTRDTPELRQVAFGRMGMAANLGFVLGPAAAGLLGGTEWGARLPIAVAALFAAATTVAILLFLKEPPGRCPEGPPPPGALTGLHQQAKPCHSSAAARQSKGGIPSRAVLTILVATFVLFLGFNLFYAGFPVHAAGAYGWDAGELGAFFAILSGMMMLAQGPLLTFVASRLGQRSVFALGVGCLGLAVASFQLPDGPVSYVGAALYAVGNGLSWPTFQSRIAEVAGDDQGSVQGMVTSASSLAGIAGLVSGGILYPILGGRLFFVAAVLFVLVLVLTPLWFPRPRAKME